MRWLFKKKQKKEKKSTTSHSIPYATKEVLNLKKHKKKPILEVLQEHGEGERGKCFAYILAFSKVPRFVHKRNHK